MHTTFRQSRSNHRRGFTGTLLRTEIRTRTRHDDRTLIRLIDTNQASRRLGLSEQSLEQGALDGHLPHYDIGGQIRFDPDELGNWIRQHHLNALTTDDDFTDRLKP
jgi:excisionase family DNA binding protein